MKDFLLIFRMDFAAMPQSTADQSQSMTARWMDWINSIASENKLTDRGNRLSASGKVVKSDNVVTHGPYTEIKESIGGYTVIKSESYEEAVEVATGCPILTIGENVEIREISLI